MSQRIRYIAITVILLSGVLFNATAQNVRRYSLPEWVEHPYKAVSPNQYLLAVGSSTSEILAEKDALKKLSSLFLLNDEESARVIRDYRELISQKTVSDRLYQLLSVSAPHYGNIFFNTQILETFTDESGTYFVLAGIPIRETSAIYRGEINENKLLIAKLGNRLAGEQNRIRQLGLIRKALLFAQINEILQKQKENLIGQPEHDTDEFSVNQIKRRYRQVSEQCRVTINGYDVPDLIFAAVAEVLQKKGFTLTTQPSRASMSSEVTYTSQKADIQRNDARFEQWTVTIHLQDLQNGSSFKTFSIKGRDGGLSRDDAVLRAQYSAAMQIQKEFSTFLNKNILQLN